jgi:LmbE family N-acetylglucosaminyl deacetylase
MNRQKVVIFAPHPDDDILACGGTIALKIKQGYDVYIVYMTGGGNSHLYELGIASDPNPSELAELRKEEAKKALSVLGLNKDTLIFLNFEDGKLENNLCAGEGEVKQTLKNLQPLEVYFPTRWDTHRDHRATNIIVCKSLKAIHFQGFAYQYTICGREDSDYFDDEQLVDISSVLELKKKAIQEHKSQVAKLFPRQERAILDDSFIAKFLGKVEIFTQLNLTEFE